LKRKKKFSGEESNFYWQNPKQTGNNARLKLELFGKLSSSIWKISIRSFIRMLNQDNTVIEMEKKNKISKMENSKKNLKINNMLKSKFNTNETKLEK
jgi:hypothetical protein